MESCILTWVEPDTSMPSVFGLVSGALIFILDTMTSLQVVIVIWTRGLFTCVKPLSRKPLHLLNCNACTESNFKTINKLICCTIEVNFVAHCTRKFFTYYWRMTSCTLKSNVLICKSSFTVQKQRNEVTYKLWTFNMITYCINACILPPNWALTINRPTPTHCKTIHHRKIDPFVRVITNPIGFLGRTNYVPRHLFWQFF